MGPPSARSLEKGLQGSSARTAQGHSPGSGLLLGAEHRVSSRPAITIPAPHATGMVWAPRLGRHGGRSGARAGQVGSPAAESFSSSQWGLGKRKKCRVYCCIASAAGTAVACRGSYCAGCSHKTASSVASVIDRMTPTSLGMVCREDTTATLRVCSAVLFVWGTRSRPTATYLRFDCISPLNTK